MKKPDEVVIVLDLGGQNNQLLARKIRDLGVYSEIWSYQTPAEKIRERNPKGIVFASGPNHVDQENPPRIDPAVYELGIPVLAIGYGMQMMVNQLGGKSERRTSNEFVMTAVEFTGDGPLFQGFDRLEQAWLYSGDLVTELPPGFVSEGKSTHAPVAVISNREKKLYALKFHPEMEQTEHGDDIIRNFLFRICGCEGQWNMEAFIEQAVQEIREQVGSRKVLCALSGGVDSSVVAVLVHKAIGDQLTCMFIDHGLLRKGEAEQVMATFVDQFDMNVVKIDARARFLSKLAGVTDPEQKRKIIGNEFIRVFEEESARLGEFQFLAQGTIYTDIVESGTSTSQLVKSHHNVGGLPEDMEFELVEPLKSLFKDEVRKVGEACGLPHEIVWRQPFPGPGLAIRVIGEVTEEKLAIVREADAILREEIAAAGLDKEIWQYFTTLPDMRSVGVKDGNRTYAYTVGIRAVTSVDGLSAQWARIPYDVLEKISNRIVHEVDHVNRVVYDITSKPPATIEWE